MKGQVEIKQFVGSMNLDDPPEVLQAGEVRIARNIEFFGTPPNMRAQNIVGNTLIPNALLPLTGVNLTIGAHYDAVNQRIFFFNYNSGGLHGIYIYYTLLGTFARLVQTGTNTQGDPLAFLPSPRISSIDILYGDGGSGDLLFFIDSLKRPRKLNINRLLAGTYSPIKDNYLKVIKAPPIIPPVCVYENDNLVTSNSLVNSLLKFSYTQMYDDFEESVLSSACAMALPSDPFDPMNNTPATRNARIRIYLQTGDQNVTKIRIYGKQTKDGSTTDWFIIDTLIKADLGIPDNSVYQYIFYNNGNYVAADPSFTVLLEDEVPQAANCQALIRTTIGYAAITEGYPFFNPSIGVVTSAVLDPQFTINGTLFYAYNNGAFTGSQRQITVVLTGVGINDGFNNPNVLEKPPFLMVVRAKTGATDRSFSFNNSGALTSISSILSGVQAAAVTAGWTFVSSSSNSVTLYFPTGDMILQSSYAQGIAVDNSPYKSAQFAFYPQAAYAWGVVYYDVDGRTNGVISNISVQAQMPPVNGTVGRVQIGLGGYTPPTWAVYYHIVRTDNLTYNKYLDWVSTSAYANTGALIATQYAYFGLSNIGYYNTQIGATEGVIGYGFSPGDRIRVTGRYAANGTFNLLNFDYAITGVVVNPVVQGQVQVGTFIQISYPVGDIIPGAYTFDGTSDFQNYQILIYSYKAQNISGQNVYFETGQEYGIGNPGTNAAYHMGNIGDNIVQITDGDIFYRQRTVPVVNEYYINCGTFDQHTTGSTLWVNPGGGGTPIVDNPVWNIVGGTNTAGGIGATEYPTYAQTDWTIFNKSAQPFSVRLRQTVVITDKTDGNGQFTLYLKIQLPGNVVSTYPVIPLKTGLAVGVANEYSYDVTVVLPALGKAWLVSIEANEIIVAGGIITLNVIRNRVISVFDKSFSDIYSLVTNSDNRPNILDANARQTYFSTLFRFSGTYQLGTNINNTNRFFPNNFDEWEKSFGDVIRMRVRATELRIFQKRRCGHTGIFAKYLKDNSGSNVVVTTDSLISPNNVEYFEGEYGIGNQPDSLCSSGFADYFYDPVKGHLLRLSLDGIQSISELYKVQSFSGGNLPNYLNNYNGQFGGTSVIIGCYNVKSTREGEAIFALQSGAMGAKTIPGQSIAFNEKYNAWTSIYDLNPDALVCAENVLYSFSNGQLWVHNNTTNYCNFFGVQFFPSMQLVFNENMVIKKKYLTLSYQGNQIWCCPAVGDIASSNFNPQTGLQQLSQLLEVDFEIDENIRNAAFLYDANSMSNQQLAIVQGDYLLGNWIQCNLTYRGSQFAFLYLPYIRYAASPKNP